MCHLLVPPFVLAVVLCEAGSVFTEEEIIGVLSKVFRTQ
jgi:hypothetical protein